MRKKEKSEQKKRRGRGWLILLAVIAWLLLVGLMLLVLDAPGVRFYMVGDEDMTIEYGTDFTDPGVYAVPIGRLLGANDRTYGIETRGDTTFIVTSGISDWAIDFKTGTKSEYVIIEVESSR